MMIYIYSKFHMGIVIRNKCGHYFKKLVWKQMESAMWQGKGRMFKAEETV